MSVSKRRAVFARSVCALMIPPGKLSVPVGVAVGPDWTPDRIRDPGSAYRRLLGWVRAITVVFAGCAVLLSVVSPSAQGQAAEKSGAPPAVKVDSAAKIKGSEGKATLSDNDLLGISSAVGSCMFQLLPAIIVAVVIVFFDLRRDSIGIRPKTFRLIYLLVGVLITGGLSWIALLSLSVGGALGSAAHQVIETVVLFQCLAALIGMVALVMVVREL